MILVLVVVAVLKVKYYIDFIKVMHQWIGIKHYAL